MDGYKMTVKIRGREIDTNVYIIISFIDRFVEREVTLSL